MRRSRLATALLFTAAIALPSQARPFGEEPLRDGYILAAANTPGANGTFWKTDVWIHNAGDTTALVAFWFLPAGRSGEPIAKGQIRVEPGETAEIPNILGTILRATDPAGAIEFRVMDGSEVFVQSRTYSGTSDRSPLAASSLSDAASATSPARIEGLPRSVVFRANLSLVNPTAKTVDAVVEAFDDDGKSAFTQRVILEPRSWLGLTDVLAPLVRVREAAIVVRPEGDGRLFALASVVSSENGDSVPYPAETSSR